MNNLFFCLFICSVLSFFFLFLSVIWLMKNGFFLGFLWLRVLYFYKIIIKYIIQSIIFFLYINLPKSFQVYNGDPSELSSSFCFYINYLSRVNERKRGSRTRLSLIALHAELRKQMLNIVALPLYRSCAGYAHTPPMLVTLRLFLLLPSVVHIHSSLSLSLSFRH
jgi:hypothetical protein